MTKKKAKALERDKRGYLSFKELEKLCSNSEDADIVSVNFYAAMLKESSGGPPDCYSDKKSTAPETLLNDDIFQEEKLILYNEYIKKDYITIKKAGVEMAVCENDKEKIFEAYYRSDMWSVGCIIFIIFSNDGVFDDNDDP